MKSSWPLWGVGGGGVFKSFLRTPGIEAQRSSFWPCSQREAEPELEPISVNTTFSALTAAFPEEARTLPLTENHLGDESVRIDADCLLLLSLPAPGSLLSPVNAACESECM